MTGLYGVWKKMAPLTVILAVIMAGSAAAQPFRLDNETGGLNALGFGWYSYIDGYGTGAAGVYTPPTVFEPNATSGQMAASFTFANLVNNAVDMSDHLAGSLGFGTDLSASTAAGIGASFANVTSISFYANGPVGLVFQFNVETVDNTSANPNAYRREFTIAQAGWVQYTIPITPITPITLTPGAQIGQAGSGGSAGQLTQEPWHGYAFTFDRTRATKLSWSIKADANKNGTVQAGTFSVNRVEITGFSGSTGGGDFQAGHSCLSGTVCTPIANQTQWDACPSANRVLSTSAVCQGGSTGGPEFVLDDFETEGTANKLGGYWYTYHIETATVQEYAQGAAGTGSGGTGRAGSMTFSGLGATPNYSSAAIGTNLTAVDGVPVGADFNGVTAIKFSARGTTGWRIGLRVETTNTPTGGEAYAIQEPANLPTLTGTGWQTFTVPISSLSLPSWYITGNNIANDYPFVPANATSIDWVIRAEHNAGVTGGTLYIDDVVLVGFTGTGGGSGNFQPGYSCLLGTTCVPITNESEWNACANRVLSTSAACQGGSTGGDGIFLVSDFETDLSSRFGGTAWWFGMDALWRGASDGGDVVLQAADGRASAALTQHTVQPSYPAGSASKQAYGAAIGLNIDFTNTIFKNLSGFTGITLDYMTTNVTGSIAVKLLDTYSDANNDGVDFSFNLPVTNGTWTADRAISFSQFTLPSWACGAGGNFVGTAACRSFNPANITQIQIVAGWNFGEEGSVGSAGSILAIDNVRLTGFNGDPNEGLDNGGTGGTEDTHDPAGNRYISRFSSPEPGRNMLGGWWYGKAGGWDAPDFADGDIAYGLAAGRQSATTTVAAGQTGLILATNLFPEPAAGTAPEFVNASGYAGINFWYRTTGTGISAQLELADGAKHADNALPTQRTLKLPATHGVWSEVRVPFDSLAGTANFNTAALAQIFFHVTGAAGDVFSIANVMLHRDVDPVKIPPQGGGDGPSVAICHSCVSSNFAAALDRDTRISDFGGATPTLNQLGAYWFANATDWTEMTGTAGGPDAGRYHYTAAIPSGKEGMLLATNLHTAATAAGPFFDFAGGHTGVYFEYRTVGAGIEHARFELHSAGSAMEPYTGLQGGVNLPATNGVWMAARIGIADLTVTGAGSSFAEAAAIRLIIEGAAGDGLYIANVYFISSHSSIAEIDREAPEYDYDDVAFVVPFAIRGGEFYAGPSPVARSGSVNLFWSGRAVTAGRLLVYDASGSVVSRLPVSTGSRGVISSWNLLDSRGRPVATGTYLVRGVLTTSAGQERVSVRVTVVE